MDVEGTTTSISFVHEVLFPYASKNMEAFVRDHSTSPHVLAELEAVKTTILKEEGKVISIDEAIQQLLDWIEQDRKHTSLKTLQGLLWKNGYESGEYKGHIYEDVLPALQKWQAADIQMGIYSSGSVAAQKLLFGNSNKGDLSPYLSAHFDTQTGHKKETQSYHSIQKQLGIPAEQILFLSDVEAELDAAKAAGFQTLQLVRPGTTASQKHPVANDFSEIDLSDF